MCVIIYKPLNVKLDYADLDRMWEKNHDGAGLAYFVHPNNDTTQPLAVHVEKGFMKLGELKTRLDELDAEYKDYQIAIHLRHATHGGVKEELTHPFAIDKDLDTAYAVLDETYPAVLMHNGVISGYGNHIISDTLDFTYSVLAYVEPQARLKVLALEGGKYLIMQNGSFQFVGNWDTYKGMQLSNIYWKWEPTPYYGHNIAAPFVERHYPVVHDKKGKKHNKKKQCGFVSSYTNLYDEDEPSARDYYVGDIVDLKAEDIKEITENNEVVTDPVKIRDILESEMENYCGDISNKPDLD